MSDETHIPQTATRLKILQLSVSNFHAVFMSAPACKNDGGDRQPQINRQIPCRSRNLAKRSTALRQSWNSDRSLMPLSDVGIGSRDRQSERLPRKPACRLNRFRRRTTTAAIRREIAKSTQSTEITLALTSS
jgi:hypothetical protein